jgi:ribosome-binding factor A
MMAGKRVARLNEQMKRELILLLQREVRDPRVSGVTITDVEVAPDLYHARVYYAVAAHEDRDTALEGLHATAGFLRGEIGRRMHIRRAPELHFTLDETLEHARHIEQLLQQARAETPPADEAGGDDDAGGGAHGAG